MQPNENVFRSIVRDVRAIGHGVHLAPPRSRPGQAQRFARALQSRYAGQKQSVLRVRLILKRNPPGISLTQIRRDTWLQFAPRLALTLLAWSPQPQQKTPALQRLPGPRLERPVETARLQRILSQRPEVAFLEVMTRRLSARGRRVEAATDPLALSHGKEISPARPTARPVSRIFRQTPAFQPPAEADPALPQGPRSTPAPFSSGQGAWQPRAEVRSLDIQQVTNQVIQAIDQRIIAQRERMGRV